MKDEKRVESLITGNFKKENIFVQESNIVFTYKELFKYLVFCNLFFESKNIKKIMISLPQGFYAYATVLGAFFSKITFCTIRCDDPIDRKMHYFREFEPDIILCDVDDSFWNCDMEDKLYIVHKQMYNNTHDLGLKYDGKQSVAYVMFTSGTTGKPKGVQIKRAALCKSVLWMYNKFGLIEEDICSQYSFMSFDMSLIDIFLAATAGARLIPFPTLTDKLFPEKLIKKYKITFWHSVPTVIDILNSRKVLTNEWIGTIKKSKIGGDRILVNQLKVFLEVLPDLRVFITYGTTEITFICTCVEVNSQNYLLYAKHNMSIGFPIDGWDVILDNEENGVGQIVIVGNNIGVGYLNSQESRFGYIIYNGKKEPAFYTGDYGKFIDGCLYYIGRKDQQIKIAGNRISLSEIDTIVRDIEGCLSAVSIFVEGKIILFYSGTLTEESIRRTIHEKLPDVCMPYKIIALSSMPYNNSGKIDRYALVKMVKGEQNDIGL